MLAGRGRGKIRAPKRGLVKDNVDLDETWQVLDRAFREIHARNASTLSFEELFRNAYKLVLKRKADFLFERVTHLESEILDNNVKTQVRALATPALLSSNDTDTSANEKRAAGERFMAILTRAFKQHSTEAGMITDVLMYMDRVSTADGKKPSIHAVAMDLFRERILNAPANDALAFTVLDLLMMVILDMVALERGGDIIDRNLVRASCRMLESMYNSLSEQESTRLYLNAFEPQFLEASRDYYKTEGKSLVEEADATTFCNQAVRRLREEEERCEHSLSRSTIPKIISVVEQELISAHIRDIINLPGTGVKNMLDNDKMDDLKKMFDLVKRVDPRLKPLKDAIHARLMELGGEINKAAIAIASQPPPKPSGKSAEKSAGSKAAPAKQVNQQTLAAINWVEEVLKLKAKYDMLWERAFASDPTMEKGLEISFQDFINENSRSPEFLSLFLDQYLKSNEKNKSEAEVDQLLDSGVTLIQYLAAKDEFENYYHKHMAKRLLMGRTISRDVERQMLSKMKMRLGNNFTVKMEGLLKDVELSETLTDNFKEHMTKSDQDRHVKIDLTANVLTTTVWPIPVPEAADRSCIFPAEAAAVKDAFERFYLNKHTGRKLTWLPTMGDVTMRVTYERNGKPITYEVNGPPYIMVILLLFNDHERLSFDEMQQLTNIPADKLNQTLISIAVAPKTRLLKKEPMSREINTTDIFSYNAKFEHAFRKFKVALVSEQANKVETAEQRKETQKKADDERGLAIDAAVVRIMKARKALTHQELMTETIQILSSRFQPDVNMIKKKIESLIEREYLERGEDTAVPSYNYLA